MSSDESKTKPEDDASSSEGYLSDLSRRAKQTADELSRKYQESVKPHVDKAVDSTAETLRGLKAKYDDSSVKPVVDSAVEKTGDALDTVSGKKILELVEARLELQARYNDILATKLDEALRRIDALERSNRQ